MMGRKGNALGVSREGLAAALSIKQSYKNREPLVVPGEGDRLLVPENLLNTDIDLQGFEDPLALAMMCSRDPESPMALAATARLCPLGDTTPLVKGVVQIIGETSKHDLVRECLKYVTERAFDPQSIGKVRSHASKIVIESRKQFTLALRENLKCLLDGDLAPRQFVGQFFELTEAGNLRHDIRKKLVLSLLLSSSVRPSIKFLMLENFHRMPRSVQQGILSAVTKAEPSRHTDIIREELHYIVTQERIERDGLDINGRPAPTKPAAAPKLSAVRHADEDFPTPLPGEQHPEKPKPWFLI